MTTPHGRFNVLRVKARVGLLIEGVALVAAAFVAYLLVTYVLDRNLRLEASFRLLLLGAFALWCGWLCYRRIVRPMRVDLSDAEMALAVEREMPQLRQQLISAVEFERALLAGAPTVESRDLMATVVADVRGRVAGIPFQRALDRARVRRFGGLALAAVSVVAGWALLDPASLDIWARRNLGLSAVPWPRLSSLAFLGLDSADSRRHPQGDDLTLEVSAAGGAVVPDQVVLHYEFASGDSGAQPMTLIGAERFTLTLPTVLEDLAVWAEGGDGISEVVTIGVVARPRIEELTVELVFPDYMGLPARTLEEPQADIQVPRGGSLRLRGRATKRLLEAYAIFDQDLRQEMEVGSDRRSFDARFVPSDTGLLVLDVLDEDRLGTGKPPRLFVRLTEDEPPVVENRAVEIGSLVTAIARIPGVLTLQDDYGLTTQAASYRITPEDLEGTAAAEQPFVPAEVSFLTEIPAGATSHQSRWLLDLLPLNPDSDPDSPDNRVRPGDQISLRFSGADNFGPGEPQVTYSEVLNFRVVTRQKLLEELARRQADERRELVRVRDEERLARNELAEIVSPIAADPRAGQARTRIQTLGRDQQSLGDRVRGVAGRYRRILLEMENNRVFEPPQIRTIADKITAPLDFMAREDFPVTARAVTDFAASGEEDLRTSIVESYDSIIERIELVLLNMQDVESLAAILESLREVITDEENVMAEVRRRQAEQIEQLLNPGRIRKDRDGKKKDGG